VLKHNFEAAVVLPNRADVFVHLYFDPSLAEHVRALAWLQRARWAVSLVAEVYNDTLAQQITAGLPHYETLQQKHGWSRKDAEKLASMWRKIKLADELRRQHETRRGFTYRVVMRTRFDIAYGAPIAMGRVQWQSDRELLSPGSAEELGRNSLWRMPLEIRTFALPFPCSPSLLRPALASLPEQACASNGVESIS
jgi:hypothetical protein